MPRIYSNFSEGKKEIAKRMKIADMEAATAKAERENGNCRSGTKQVMKPLLRACMEKGQPTEW